MSRSGADLALLLLAGFRVLAERARAELDRQGYPDIRPGHDFALRSVDGGATTVAEVARRTSVSKQAAAKTIAALEAGGYVTRGRDPHDARRSTIEVTDRGRRLMRDGEAIFAELRTRWEREIGRDDVARIEAGLIALVGEARVPLDRLPADEL